MPRGRNVAVIDLADIGREFFHAGNARLLTPGLQQTLCEHAAGNLRLLMNMANELFATACSQNLSPLDEKLYLQVFTPAPKPAQRRLRP